MTTLHVLALTADAAEPFLVAGHRIEVVPCDAVYAAVECVAERPVLSEAALRTQHAIVTQIARRVDAILPARFGSVVDLEELTRLVTRRREAIQEALALVRGRDQMTVRLFASDVPPAGRTFAPVTAASGTAYLQERRRAASPALPRGVASIGAAVRGLVAAERSEPGQGRVAATVYHLIERGAIGPYRAALESLQSGLEAETMTISGPWPPFAFVPDLWPLSDR